MESKFEQECIKIMEEALSMQARINKITKKGSSKKQKVKSGDVKKGHTPVPASVIKDLKAKIEKDKNTLAKLEKNRENQKSLNAIKKEIKNPTKGVK